MDKELRLARWIYALLAAALCGGILAVLAMPLLMRWLGHFYANIYRYYWPHVVLFMLSGSGAVIIVWQLRRMFRTVLDRNCFVWQNVRSLRCMGRVALAMALVIALRLLLVFTPATVILVLVFLLAGLFALVLAGVFAQAVQYKEENDLTI